MADAVEEREDEAAAAGAQTVGVVQGADGVVEPLQLARREQRSPGKRGWGGQRG